jgi:hypothetical protein
MQKSRQADQNSNWELGFLCGRRWIINQQEVPEAPHDDDQCTVFKDGFTEAVKIEQLIRENAKYPCTGYREQCEMCTMRDERGCRILRIFGEEPLL